MKRDRVKVIFLSALEQPDTGLVLAAIRSGAVGILDLSTPGPANQRAIEELVSATTGAFGVRLSRATEVDTLELPTSCKLVVAPLELAADLRIAGRREVFGEVRSATEARNAMESGTIDGLVLSGSEAGGAVGKASSFILLQEIAAEARIPIWVRGGIGLHTGAAAVAGGATGLVFDIQLGLLRESSVAPEVQRALETMDGSETHLVGGRRLFSRPDLAQEALPIGEDGALAKAFRARFVCVGDACRGIQAEVSRALHRVRELTPLAPDHGVAAVHGLRYPIFQGPMTRVSDCTRFAEAVAHEGGMPSLALSLMGGEQARQLLEETSAALGKLPWAVGVLGFAPPEIRAAQLAAIEATRPPVAIIAGGRPSQARPLEELGIATYLHVPSPGLLELFLEDGARRFVFEGRECGGHVGPRSSFTLWELQIEILLGMEDLNAVCVLFAGGIHDEVSAAMVATLTSRLVERGASVGVLMGTAYLFTHEAVSSGAIGQVYQQEAIACSETTLLETAPGHLTRCADSGYVATFEAEQSRLRDEGARREDAWVALESLNLGRLRLASKGLQRQGDTITKVDVATQRDEGLFMLGQVASQHDSVRSIRALHEAVSVGSSARVVDLSPPSPTDGVRPADVAIVGMACIFPDADGLDAYWTNVLSGHDAIREVPQERWNADVYWDPDGVAGHTTPSKWGGFIPDVPFDPYSFGMPPKSLTSIDPAQLLGLEVARRALADAGYADREFDRSRTSVIFGAEAGTDLSAAYGFRALYPQYAGPVPDALDDALPRLTEDSFPGVLANVIAGRVANRLDLGGVNFTVDAACAASLAAVDSGVKELLAGSSDMVLCGAADLHNSINDYLMFASVHALSRAGKCQPFGSKADGIALGEGVACIVIKRLEDAERDGDRVYAVIKAISGSSDGRSLGLTAPREDGQVSAMQRAYERAGVTPSDVGVLEAHGTGTVVGDRTELSSLERVWRTANVATATCALGSVKSQIGHTKCAAGLAGLIKTALSLHHRALPPTLHIDEPNPAYDPACSPFTLSDKARPWLHPKRQAGVSAFGFGGTNFHAVLAGVDTVDAVPASGHHWPAEIIVLRGESMAQSQAKADAVLAYLHKEPGVALQDVAATLARQSGKVQIAIVTESVTQLMDQLRSLDTPASDRVYRAGEHPGQIAFLYAGQGSQRPHMLADVFLAFPRMQRVFEGRPELARKIFPPRAFTAEERRAQRQAMKDTRVAQPSLGMVNLALDALLRELGVFPDMVGGHSYGELAALAAAGVFETEDLLRLSEFRGECILASAGDDPGTMAAVRESSPRVRELLAGLEGVVIANENAPQQTVISGDSTAVHQALALLESAGVSAKEIPVACAFHSPKVADATEDMYAHLQGIAVSAPEIPVWSNSTAQVYPDGAEAIRAMVATHITSPVRFQTQVEAMHAAGARVFLEVGPGRVLTGLVDQILAGREYRAIACDEPGARGLRAFLVALGELIAAGVAVEPGALFDGRDGNLIETFDIDAPGVKPEWVVNGHRASPANGPLPAGGLQTVLHPPVSAAPASTRNAVTPEGALIEFLGNMREQVFAQRDVMMAYFGQAAPVAHQAPARLVSNHRATEMDRGGDPEPILAKADNPPEERNPMQVLLGIVSEKTGYPIAMLDPDLDLEAELSIDSIKRIEIIGALGKSLGFASASGAQRDNMVEQLARIKTLRGIVEWLAKDQGDSDAAEPSGQSAPESTAISILPPSDSATQADPPSTAQRYVRALSELPPAPSDSPTLQGRQIAIAGGGLSFARSVQTHLERLGARVSLIQSTASLEQVDTILYISPDSKDPTDGRVKELFELVQTAVLGGVREIVGVTRLGGDPAQSVSGNQPRSGGAGVSGLLKSVAKEWPKVRVRCVDVDARDDDEIIAAQIVNELCLGDDHLEIAYSGGERRVVSYVPSTTRANSEIVPIDLGSSAVVLITGGARGITAHVARDVAKRFQCHLVLVGRSLAPTAEDERLEGALDLAQLRSRLAHLRELATPADIDREARRVLAAREISSTLADIEAANATVEYRSVDVRNENELESLIDELYARYGRIDGIIHGAGVIEDGLLRDKSPESFDRVYETKAAGARVIARAVRDDIRFVVFFSSVSAAFGNRGQTDYAAANDTLDKLAIQMNHRLKGRVVSIAWGPWAGAGMVSEDLEAEYRRRGIGLISPTDGVARFIEELQRGNDAEAQVVWMCATPMGMAG